MVLLGIDAVIILLGNFLFLDRQDYSREDVELLFNPIARVLGIAIGIFLIYFINWLLSLFVDSQLLRAVVITVF